MALYIPASRRRRNALLMAAAALVIGLALGYLVGKAGQPSFAGEVRSAQHKADDLATQLERLPIGDGPKPCLMSMSTLAFKAAETANPDRPKKKRTPVVSIE